MTRSHPAACGLHRLACKCTLRTQNRGLSRIIETKNQYTHLLVSKVLVEQFREKDTHSCFRSEELANTHLLEMRKTARFWLHFFSLLQGSAIESFCIGRARPFREIAPSLISYCLPRTEISPYSSSLLPINHFLFTVSVQAMEPRDPNKCYCGWGYNRPMIRCCHCKCWYHYDWYGVAGCASDA